MKKTYFNPSLDIIKINANHQLLAGSETTTPLSSGNPTEWGAREFDFDED